MTSCKLAPDACSSAWMEGAATLTTDASSTAMNCPVSTTARAPQALPAVRRGARVAAGTVRVLVTCVMSISLPGIGSGYQEPAYPGTSSTWQARSSPGTMEV